LIERIIKGEQAVLAEIELLKRKEDRNKLLRFNKPKDEENKGSMFKKPKVVVVAEEPDDIRE
jgi:hypothetical protein